MDPIISTIEEIAKIGWYETDLIKRTWTGSDNFIKLFGLKKKESYPIEEFQALVHPDDFQQVMQNFTSCLESGSDFNCEYRCKIPDGRIIHVLSRSKIFFDSTGKPVRVVGVKQDISAQKVFENELLRLTELNRSKTELLGFVAHDLRSPLAQLKSLALLLKLNATPDQVKFLETQLKVCDTAMGIDSGTNRHQRQ
jgi:PAS domain S-box-containing protein